MKLKFDAKIRKLLDVRSGKPEVFHRLFSCLPVLFSGLHHKQVGSNTICHKPVLFRNFEVVVFNDEDFFL